MCHLCLNQSLSTFTTNPYSLQLAISRLLLESSDAEVWTSSLPHITHSHTHNDLPLVHIYNSTYMLSYDSSLRILHNI